MAVECGRRAVAAFEDGDPDAGRILTNHLLTLEIMVEDGADPEALQEAVAVARRAVRAGPEAQAYRLRKLLRTSVRREDLGALPELTAVLRRLLDTAPPGHEDRLGRLAELAEGLREQYDLTGDVQAPAAAVPVGQELVGREGLGSSGLATADLRILLGRALAARYARTRDEADAEEAVTVWRQGALASTGRAEARLEAAVSWARFADSSGSATAVEAYGEAVDLLEQGRSVLWAQLLDLRTDLKAVEDHDPELARRFVAVRSRLDRPASALQRP